MAMDRLILAMVAGVWGVFGVWGGGVFAGEPAASAYRPDVRVEQASRTVDDLEERIQALRAQVARARQADSPAERRLLLREHGETLRMVLRQMQEQARGGEGCEKAGVGGAAGYCLFLERRISLLLSLMEQMVVHMDVAVAAAGGGGG
ncbi:MAG: hypothetical protein HQL66_13980 [Magnetococcales bacterium]|nr:hypothetical protein [Magnetococcales bacterium]